jgi:hypothetical protein
MVNGLAKPDFDVGAVPWAFGLAQPDSDEGAIPLARGLAKLDPAGGAVPLAMMTATTWDHDASAGSGDPFGCCFCAARLAVGRMLTRGVRTWGPNTVLDMVLRSQGRCSFWYSFYSRIFAVLHY